MNEGSANSPDWHPGCYRGRLALHGTKRYAVCSKRPDGNTEAQVILLSLRDQYHTMEETPCFWQEVRVETKHWRLKRRST